MNFLPSNVRKGALLGLLFFLSYISLQAQDGKAIFSANCASCHALDKQLTGPALRGVETRGPWTDRANVVKWVHNPGGFIPTTPYTQQLAASMNGQIMPSFPQLSEKEIFSILDYIKSAPAPGAGPATPAAAGAPQETGNGELIFGVISIVLAIIALILMQVNSNLKKLSDDKEQILRPEPVPFWRNKIYIALFAVILFVVGGFYVAKSAIGLGRQQGYQPTQPIFFSHKVHAGVNQINCLYCHSAALESKHAMIPPLNVCMNCHKAINAYEKGPKIYDENGKEINGTAEIKKLYDYAGFTPGPGAQWDPSKARSPQWVKIHNLPDHVYFNHAQHTRVGNVACQTCHGNIQEMDKVAQASSLSMGWCINCHRQQKIAFNYNDSTGNKFYSIYEKFHNDFKSGKMDSLTVKDIGGLECQKCHY
ncbi:c-type cytochrome [Flavisolibacter nicotianae]|uniref:c-type cytochrome n=1 Tax=Flavisolibacter nicotianae TaxID=2364882 RepID=UPI000EABA318|nr:c-type cytochrome [Flavisolibacter nicotianae]